MIILPSIEQLIHLFSLGSSKYDNIFIHTIRFYELEEYGRFGRNQIVG